MAKRPIKAPSKRKAAPSRTQARQGATQWAALERSPQFVELKRAKLAFIVPACFVFIAYYFALPLLVGYAPALMATKVFGAMNLAYLFALSQFFMAWILAALYVRAAGSFDQQAAHLVGMGTPKGGQR